MRRIRWNQVPIVRIVQSKVPYLLKAIPCGFHCVWHCSERRIGAFFFAKSTTSLLKYLTLNFLSKSCFKFFFLLIRLIAHIFTPTSNSHKRCAGYSNWLSIDCRKLSIVSNALKTSFSSCKNYSLCSAKLIQTLTYFVCTCEGQKQHSSADF